MTITIQCTAINSNLAASDLPDMIEFDAPADFENKAIKLQDFMRTNTVREMRIEHAFKFRLFRNVKNIPDDELGGADYVSCGGATYAPFDPSYKITGCDAMLDVTGEMRVLLPVGEQGAVIICALGYRPF